MLYCLFALSNLIWVFSSFQVSDRQQVVFRCFHLICCASGAYCLAIAYRSLVLRTTMSMAAGGRLGRGRFLLRCFHLAAPRVPGVLPSRHINPFQQIRCLLLQVNDWEEDVFRCFHLVRCASSAEWLATLAALPGTLRQLAPGVARLLLVDNTAAFLYQDRANRGPMFGGAATVCGQPPLSLQRVHTAAAAMIQVWRYMHDIYVAVSDPHA